MNTSENDSYASPYQFKLSREALLFIPTLALAPTTGVSSQAHQHRVGVHERSSLPKRVLLASRKAASKNLLPPKNLEEIYSIHF